MLAVYLAAPFQLRDWAREVMRTLELAGIDVTSSWLRIDDMPDSDDAARLDLADVDRAHVLVLLNPATWRSEGTGGRHTEFGYAVANGKGLVILGARTNTFHHLSSVLVAADVETLLQVLRTLTQEYLQDVAPDA